MVAGDTMSRRMPSREGAWCLSSCRLLLAACWTLLSRCVGPVHVQRMGTGRPCYLMR